MIPLIAAGALWLVDVRMSGETYESAVHEVPARFSSAIASWNVSTAAGGWIAVQMRTRVGTRWTRWYDMGHWSATLDGGHRHSIAHQSDEDGAVDTDTLNLKRPANALQLRAQLHPASNGRLPRLELLAVATNLSAPAAVNSSATSSNTRDAAWGIDLDVPELTQRLGSEGGAYGGGGDSWCSPASIAMVMNYWARRLHRPEWMTDVEAAAKGTYDPVYDGCGNWPFNVAFASERGLRGWIQRFTALSDIERLIARGIPVIASIRVAPHELDGSPYEKTDGHLLVVRGFTSSGDVVCNDPYGEPGAIRRVYRRDQFDHVWQRGSHGAVYVIAPPDQLQ